VIAFHEPHGAREVAIVQPVEKHDRSASRGRVPVGVRGGGQRTLPGGIVALGQDPLFLRLTSAAAMEEATTWPPNRTYQQQLVTTPTLPPFREPPGPRHRTFLPTAPGTRSPSPVQ
jgi:hypothetical protein